MFSKNIILRDWDISVQGFDQVSAANQKIFDSVRTIVVSPINIFVDENTAIGELKITINDLEVINVVDLIEFNQDLKIVAIKAYKG
jgi:steroid delta-isomerase